MVKTSLMAVYAVILLTCCSVVAQNNSFATQPFYLCNVIVVQTADNAEVIRQKLKMSFIHQGYQITSSDVRAITGRAKVNATLVETVTAVITDSSISYAGTYAYESTGAAQGSQAATHHPADTHEIEYKGKKNSDSMAAFTKMNHLAKSYGEKTYYFFQ